MSPGCPCFLYTNESVSVAYPTINWRTIGNNDGFIRRFFVMVPFIPSDGSWYPHSVFSWSSQLINCLQIPPPQTGNMVKSGYTIPYGMIKFELKNCIKYDVKMTHMDEWLCRAIWNIVFHGLKKTLRILRSRYLSIHAPEKQLIKSFNRNLGIPAYIYSIFACSDSSWSPFWSCCSDHSGHNNPP